MDRHLFKSKEGAAADKCSTVMDRHLLTVAEAPAVQEWTVTH